jgi:hypothetical protein
MASRVDAGHGSSGAGRSRDPATCEGTGVASLKQSFAEAVGDYLARCKKRGKSNRSRVSQCQGWKGALWSIADIVRGRLRVLHASAQDLTLHL